ncbi:hypothetical protein CK203_073356 [Vitis vinifera]|uniref:Bifunctional inhibitor/plant lipid transfer protein/seed storage helical domain-containing protein n=1 Tax=Vitis vinifera TaxID=29760 RepID=A0A438ESL7_VITVI|nr:hypothetical protein CK203_073356 [Vitis vinifera]
MGANKMCESAVVVAVVVAVMMAGVGEAQNTASCASELTACADYLNSTSPPANCCTPLKNAVENDKDCLCNLYNNPSLLQSLNINVTDALQLPKNCGITEELNCNASSPSPTGSPPGKNGWPSISVLLCLMSWRWDQKNSIVDHGWRGFQLSCAQATPGKDGGGASMVAWTGMSSLLLLCASLML